jgi:hypothetical protein
MSAELYNKVRRILFCTANNPKKTIETAFEYLEKTYKKKLTEKEYVGLLAELKFFELYKNKFQLTVAGDMGEHADFTGTMGEEHCRFDVTTNLNFKKYKDYKPYFTDGPRYKIALLDDKNFNIIDVLVLSFEQCFCGGYKIPFLLIGNENHNHCGEPLRTNDLIVMSCCNLCYELEEINRCTHHEIQSPQEYFDNISNDAFENNNKDLFHNKIVDEYSFNLYRYFQTGFTEKIMGIAGHNYNILKFDGDGSWYCEFYFRHQAVKDALPADIEYGLN